MPVCVDVHSHVYSATYMEMLRKRTEVPRILPGATLDGPERLLILPSEDQVASTTSGRPVGAEYFDITGGF
jgi:aminocarboxymuconate-semialdehyde decarboxylase